MTVTLLTDLGDFEAIHAAGIDLRVRRCEQGLAGVGAVWRALRLARHCDYALFEYRFSGAVLFCLLQVLLPGHRCRLVLQDLFLPSGSGLRWNVRRALARLAMRRVHLFLVHVKDTRSYEHFFARLADAFRYVPYKVNQLETISRLACSDNGYIFSGGYSRRDYPTLIRAAAGLPWPVVIVTGPDALLAVHGSVLNEVDLPPNVRVIRSDGSPGPFLEQMAGARVVVIPTRKDATCQAGIAVYLMAMALGKCVIASEGPGASDVLQDGEAILVPPGDAARLRDAIIRAMTDNPYRDAYARRGKEYALALGDTHQLQQRIARVLIEDAQTRRKQSLPA